MLPFISVIIPVYNIEKYVRTCINSVVEQTYNKIEIVLVDDGSTDCSGTICDEYAKIDNRIIVIHQQNCGLVSARKTGAKVAQGEYIVCIDGDDWVDKRYIANMVMTIIEYKADIACCGAIWTYENRMESKKMTEYIGVYDRKKIEKKIIPHLIEDEKGQHFPSTIWGKIFRKDIYFSMQNEVDTRINIGEDYACVNPFIFVARRMVVIDECLYYYRQNPKSMTNVKKAYSWNYPRLLALHYKKMLPLNEYDLKDQISRNIVHQLFNVAASQFYRKESYRSICQDIKNNTDKEDYKNAISHCYYNKRYLTGRIALMALKHHLTLLIWMYSKIMKR